MILKDAISFRAVSKVTRRCFSFLPILEKTKIASHSTLIRWIKRVGLYKLTQPLEIADDWIGIIDASIAIVNKKCLVILGVRSRVFLEKIKQGRALALEDVNVLHMGLAKTINSQVVYEALKTCQKRIGQFCQTCGDGGSEVVGGVKLLQKDAKQQGRVIYHAYDISHKLACLLKAEIAEDPQWQEFVKEAAASKLKLQLGEWGHLCSPNQRSKSRYMNMEQFHGWGAKILMILNDPKDPAHTDVLRCFSWVKKYEEMIKLHGEYLGITEAVRHKIRMEGVSARTHSELYKRYLNLPMSGLANEFCGKMLDFFENATANICLGTCLLGTSEIIESLFGKLKYLIRDDLKKGFTGSVLFTAACVGEIDCAIVKTAMETVYDQQVNKWVTKNIGETFTQKRRRCLGRNKKKPGRKAGHKQTGIIGVILEAA
jgi:hypothetical protein